MGKPEVGKKHLLLKLGRFIRPHAFWLALRIAGAVISAGAEVGIAFLVVSFADAAIEGNSIKFQANIPYMIGIVLIGMLFAYLNKYASGKLGVLVVQNIRNKAVGHILKLPTAYTQARHSGETVSRLTNGLVQIQSFLENDLPNLVFQPIRFLAAFTYMLLISWKLLLFCLIVMPVVLVVTSILSKPIQRYAQELQQTLGEVNSAAQDSIGGIQMLKAFNLKQVLFQKYAAAVDQGLVKSLAVEKHRSLMAPLNILSQFLPFVLCFLYGGYLSIQGQITPGSLLAFIQLMNYLVQPLAVIPGIIANLRGTSGAVEHLFELLDHPPEREGGMVTADFMQPPIEFEDVTFSYNEESLTLDGIHHTFDGGRTTALVGPSGSGKTTFFKLICGFYSPDRGSVKLYGRGLEEWSLPAARSLISLVSQDTYLFPGTIRENIAYGRPDASWEEIVEAAKTANAHEFIQELPERYDTVAGERGARLSGGQKQRIAIARAVLKNAPLLLLDEATSALDTQSEALVQEALERFMKGRTVLVIAHRLSTIRNADEVLVLDGGRIAERGDHKSLMEKGGLYRQLYMKQLSGEDQDLQAMQGEGA